VGMIGFSVVRKASTLIQHLFSIPRYLVDHLTCSRVLWWNILCALVCTVVSDRALLKSVQTFTSEADINCHSLNFGGIGQSFTFMHLAVGVLKLIVVDLITKVQLESEDRIDASLSFVIAYCMYVLVLMF